MESNALECEICNKVFSQENCPRILPCSHTFCGPCIDGIIATQKKTCPSCGVKFTAALAKYLMINRSLLLAAEQFGHIIPSKILKEMTKILGAIKILKEMKGGICNTNKEIETSIKKMNDIKISNENIMLKIDENIKWLRNKMNLTLHEEGKTQDAEAKLAAASTSTEPVMKIIEEVLQENKRKSDDIMKDIFTTKKQLEGVAKEIRTLKISAAKVIGGKQMVAPVKVMPGNQVQLIRFKEGNVSAKSLIINHEALMETPSRRAFLDLAVKGKRLGRLVIQVMDESKLALNFLHLCAGDLGPSYADSQFSRVDDESEDEDEEESDNNSPNSMEDPIENENEEESDNNAPNHIEDPIENFERIWVNGYTTPANTIIKKAVTNMDWNEEKKCDSHENQPHEEGEVRGYFSERKASQFYIVTKHDSMYYDYSMRYPMKRHNNYFGKVVKGLDVLKDAISRYPDMTDVRIADCGLLMSM